MGTSSEKVPASISVSDAIRLPKHNPTSWSSKMVTPTVPPPSKKPPAEVSILPPDQETWPAIPTAGFDEEILDEVNDSTDMPDGSQDLQDASELAGLSLPIFDTVVLDAGFTEDTSDGAIL